MDGFCRKWRDHWQVPHFPVKGPAYIGQWAALIELAYKNKATVSQTTNKQKTSKQNKTNLQTQNKTTQEVHQGTSDTGWENGDGNYENML